VQGINSLLVEGGAGVIKSFLELFSSGSSDNNRSDVDDISSACGNGCHCQVVVTLRPCYLGGYRSIPSELSAGPATLYNCTVASIGQDIVLHGLLHLPSNNYHHMNDVDIISNSKF